MLTYITLGYQEVMRDTDSTPIGRSRIAVADTSTSYADVSNSTGQMIMLNKRIRTRLKYE